MYWLATFSFAVLLLSLQDNHVEGRKHANPWSHPKKVNNFMLCLMRKIGSSPVFPAQEKQDLESVVQTMMSAMNSMSGSNTAKITAMNSAFATSMAGLVIAEDAGNLDKIAIKTNALLQNLKVCFKQEFGHVNKQFMVEMKDLIDMFVKEAQQNASDDDEGDYYDDDYTSVTNTDSLTFDFGTSAITPDFGTGADFRGGFDASGQLTGEPFGLDAGLQLGGGVPSGDVSTSLSGPLGSSMSKSKVFNRIFNSQMSPQKAKYCVQAMLTQLSAQLNLNQNQANKLRSDVTNAMASVGPGADTRKYINVLLPAILNSLASSGALNAANQNTVGPAITGAVIKGLASAAPRLGIDMSDIDVSADISSAAQDYSTGMDSGANVNLGGGFDASGQLTGEPLIIDTGRNMDISSPYNSFNEDSDVRSTPSLSLLLGSPNGLTSVEGNSRIRGLTESVAKALRPNGFDMNSFARSLKSLSSDLSRSGFNKSQVGTETLMEALVSLVQLLNSAKFQQIDTSKIPATSNNVAKVISSILV